MVKDSRSLQQLSSEDTEELNLPAQKGLNFRPLLRTAQRQAWLVGAIASGAIATVMLTGEKPPSIYEGTFRLLVEPVTSEAKFSEPTALTRSGGTGVPDERVFNLDYPTQLEILQSPAILGDVVEQVKLQYPKFTLEQLKEGLTVQRTGGDNMSDKTKILEVRYQGENPKQVELVLQKTAEKYRKYSLDERKNRISEGIKFIEEQLPELQRRVGEFQGQLQTIQQRYNLIDPKTQGEDLFKQVRDLTTQYIEAQRQLQEQRILYATLQKQLELTPSEALTASALSQDPTRASILEKLKEVEAQIAGESARFTPNNPFILALEDKRQNLLRLLDGETVRIVGRNASGKTSNPQVQVFQNSVRIDLIQQLVKTANEVQLLEARTQALGQTRNTFELQAQQFPRIARQYNEIDRKLEITNQTLNQLLTQRETLRVESAQKNLPWDILSDPQIVRDLAGNPAPVPQKGSRKLIMAIAGGLFLGMALAIILEKISDIFYTIEDLRDAIELPLLGVIPLGKKHKKKQPLPRWLALIDSTQKPQDMPQNPADFIEAFDLLYACVRFLYSAPPVRSIAVCSAQSGDGKSTVAFYLAQTAANSGQRVLLVDANLRHPELHDWLNLPNHKGLSDMLEEKQSPQMAIERSPKTPNLSILTAGKPSPESPKHIASPAMQRLMAELQSSFDLVIYDTPNLLEFTDASFLSTHTDGILMVVGVGETKKSLVLQAINQLNTFRLPVLGVVANYVQQKSVAPSPGIHSPSARPKDTIALDIPELPHPEMNSKSR
jgi:polysaccharide biosynthesis transport protein